MFCKSSLKTLALVSLILLATVAFAANSTTITLIKPAQVAGKQLPAGEYKVTWTGTGDNVQVKLSSAKTSATVNARLVETKGKYSSYALSADANGSIKLLYLKDKNQALAFGE